MLSQLETTEGWEGAETSSRVGLKGETRTEEGWRLPIGRRRAWRDLRLAASDR